MKRFYFVCYTLITCLFILNVKSFQPSIQRGVVCLKKGFCDYMIICLEDYDYSIAEDYYDNAEEGDVLIGEFKTYGFEDVICIIRHIVYTSSGT